MKIQEGDFIITDDFQPIGLLVLSVYKQNDKTHYQCLTAGYNVYHPSFEIIYPDASRLLHPKHHSHHPELLELLKLTDGRERWQEQK